MGKGVLVTSRGEKITFLLENESGTKGLAILIHGMGYTKEEPCIRVSAEALIQQDYVVLRFDTRHSFGESEGSFEQVTLTSSYHDLTEVIQWARRQQWYKEPFVLVGHSTGGLCTILYAEQHPHVVKGVVGISALISGKLLLGQYPAKKLEEWKRTGIHEWKENTQIKRVRWECAEDSMRYDLLPKARFLQVPLLLIVGDQDMETPLAHQQLLYDAVPHKKQLHVIVGAPHRLLEKHYLDELKTTVAYWIESLHMRV